MRPRQHKLSSCFAPKIREYIELMHHVGKVFRVEEGHLFNFDAFSLGRQHTGPLTQQLALDFSYSVKNLESRQYARRYAIVRGFANFLLNYDSRTESLNPQAIPVIPRRTLAHIYTDVEISDLIQAVRRMKHIDSFRIATYQTLIGLIASTGLRISEALHLDLDDVDLSAGMLRIRRTKFRKSRLVSVHSTTLEQLRRYVQVRNAHELSPTDPAFFLSRRLKRLSYTTVNNFFQKLRRHAGLQSATGRAPRIHDLRHTFAVRRVLAWYESGDDVQAKLPLLATYLGHAHFEDTSYYLTAGTELLAKGSERFQRSRSGSHD